MAKTPYVEPMVTIIEGLPKGHEDTAAALYWEAFSGKLGQLLGPDKRGKLFFSSTINPSGILAAADGEKLPGIAAFKHGEHGFSTAGARDLFRHYGLSALWRLPILAMLERNSAPDTLQMDGVCVSASARGQGVGSTLFDALFAHAKANGYSYVTLDVIDTNPRAKALYEKLGFEAVSKEGTSILRPILGFSSATKMRRAV